MALAKATLHITCCFVLASLSTCIATKNEGVKLHTSFFMRSPPPLQSFFLPLPSEAAPALWVFHLNPESAVVIWRSSSSLSWGWGGAGLTSQSHAMLILSHAAPHQLAVVQFLSPAGLVCRYFLFQIRHQIITCLLLPCHLLSMCQFLIPITRVRRELWLHEILQPTYMLITCTDHEINCVLVKM